MFNKFRHIINLYLKWQEQDSNRCLGYFKLFQNLKLLLFYVCPVATDPMSNITSVYNFYVWAEYL